MSVAMANAAHEATMLPEQAGRWHHRGNTVVLTLGSEAPHASTLELESGAPPSGLSEVVSGFSQYSDAVEALPQMERKKLDRLARLVASGLCYGDLAIRSVRVIGHADFDTPRRPKVEHDVALKRANMVRIAFAKALDRADGKAAPRAVPPYSSRIDWDIQSAGATRPVVPSPRSEIDRRRNRRVEISIVTHAPRPRVRLAFALPVATRLKVPGADAWVRAIVEEFCRHAPIDLVDRSNCVTAAATKAVQFCRAADAKDRDIPCQAPAARGRCYATITGATILDAKDYQAPLIAPIKCCHVNTPCRDCPDSTRCMDAQHRPTNLHCAKCNHCAQCMLPSLPGGNYLVLKYKPAPLRAMVDKLKCMLDRGCTVPVGVLSGICDDKPSTSCQNDPEPWKNCWEHWLLVIGYVGDTFVFWDSSQDSAIGPVQCDETKPCSLDAHFKRPLPRHPCMHWFGLLHYDAANARLSTARPDLADGLTVNTGGYHTTGLPADAWGQKRFQVTSMWPGFPRKSDGRRC